MNIYELHSEPKSLSHHDKAYETIPKLFWENYGNNKEELKKREKYITKDTYYSYLYARFVLKGPFPAGEEAISKNTKYSYYYVRDILEGPFPAGEEVISKDVLYAYLYAYNVLKGPFPTGEEAISKNKYFIHGYLELLSDKEQQEFKKKYNIGDN